CVCCTVRGDLIRVVEGLMRRPGRFDAIVVETTGLADPAPVAQTFFMDDDVRGKAELDAVVALVDAKHFMQRVADSPEATEQVAFADVVLLNKTDLVDEAELANVQKAIRSINPIAEIHRTERSAVAMDTILGRHAFDLEKALERDPHFLDGDQPHDHQHEHDENCGPNCGHDHHHHDHGHGHGHGQEDGIHGSDIGSLSLSAGHLDPSKFFPWINELTQTDGPDILRLKGILAFDDDPKRYVLQGVHMIVEGDHERDWKQDEERRSRLVFIGRKLDREKIQAGFDACKLAEAA
ncbi:MAG: GTP-binding protein, partial [Pseudomonadota bacterium]